MLEVIKQGVGTYLSVIFSFLFFEMKNAIKQDLSYDVCNKCDVRAVGEVHKNSLKNTLSLSLSLTFPLYLSVRLLHTLLFTHMLQRIKT